PQLPEDVPQFYLPLSSPARPAGTTGLLYQPRLLAAAEVTFVHKKRGLEHRQGHRLLVPPPAAGQAAAWATAERLGVGLAAVPAPQARWAEVPEPLNTARKLKGLEKAFADFLYNSARLVLREHGKLDLVSQPGADVLAFREQCREAARREA